MVATTALASWFDKLLGGALGFAKGGVLVVLLYMVPTGILAPENSMIRHCQLCPYVKQAAEVFRGLIKDEKIREAFSQKEPAISSKEATESPEDMVRPFVPTKFPEE